MLPLPPRDFASLLVRTTSNNIFVLWMGLALSDTSPLVLICWPSSSWQVFGEYEALYPIKATGVAWCYFQNQKPLHKFNKPKHSDCSISLRKTNISHLGKGKPSSMGKGSFPCHLPIPPNFLIYNPHCQFSLKKKNSSPENWSNKKQLFHYEPSSWFQISRQVFQKHDFYHQEKEWPFSLGGMGHISIQRVSIKEISKLPKPQMFHETGIFTCTYHKYMAN